MKKLLSRASAIAAAVALTMSANPADAAAQTTFEACRVPGVGAIYMINLPGLPTGCLDPSHVAFSWTEGGATVADGSITEVKLADDAVTAAKIATGAVGTDEILDDAVHTADILDGAVTQAKLDPNISIGLSAGDVGTAELADAAVTGAKIATDAVNNSHLSSNSVTTTEIVDGTIVGADIADGTIGGADIGADAVGSAQIIDGGVAGVDIAAGAIGTGQLATGAVDANALGANAVGTSNILDGSVTAAKLASGMPIVANTDIGFSAFFGASYGDVASVTVNAPSAGFVVLMAAGNVQITGHVSGQFSSVRVGVTDTSGTVADANATLRVYVPQDDTVGSHEVPWALTYVFPASAGSNTYYLIGAEDGSSGSGRVYNANLTALYIPG